MLSNLMKKSKIAVFCSMLILANINLNAGEFALKQNYYEPTLTGASNNFTSQLPYSPAIAENDFVESMDLFKISCDGIRYTGAVETSLINGFQQARTTIEKMLEPFTSLTTFEAAVFVLAFTKCLPEVMAESMEGSVDSDSAIVKMIKGLADSDTYVKLMSALSITTSPGTGATAYTETNVNVQDTFNNFTKEVVNSGTFDKVLECTSNARNDIYGKIYELLNHNLTIQFHYEEMMHSQCNVQLIREGETVPSWNSMFGNKISEMTDSAIASLNNNPAYDVPLTYDSVCKTGDTCTDGQYSESELGLEKRTVTEASNYKPDAGVDMNTNFPSSSGYIVTPNGDGTYNIQREEYMIGAGDYLSKTKEITALKESWSKEKSVLDAEKSAAESAEGTSTSDLLNSRDSTVEACVDGVSAIGEKCLSIEERNHILKYNKPMIKNSTTGFTDISPLSESEKIVFSILNNNPRGFENTLEYVVSKLKLLNYKLSILNKNTTDTRLTFDEQIGILYEKNFDIKLFKKPPTEVYDLEETIIRSEDDVIYITASSMFTNALLKKLIIEELGKPIPFDKKIPIATIETVLERFNDYKARYQHFIDLKGLTLGKLTIPDPITPASPSTPTTPAYINFNIYTDDINYLYGELEKYFQEQKKAIEIMFEYKTGLNTYSFFQHTLISISSKDFIKEVIRRAKIHSIEYKLKGQNQMADDIYFFYKMYIYQTNRNLKDKLEETNIMINNINMASQKDKEVNSLLKIGNENLLLEKSYNYRIIEQNIGK